MTEEVHITSLVVQVQPRHADRADAAISALPGACIHGADDNGKRVVTLEAASASAILDQVSAIQRTDGVINVAMVYQHAEPLDAMNKEIKNVEYPT
ncbi:chaperone NapD [Paracidovorax wautersii]|uniref:Chaperone NapD n=1 Tax=Paracidovorax wautersii TaxID=1177982 RepID=A0ABU1IBC4_9BURK|nr:chaperone NapD [Paracidovorax wautersii]MDR6214415.1 nitrate reductase NapD [Paracidovorax wautersii]